MGNKVIKYVISFVEWPHLDAISLGRDGLPGNCVSVFPPSAVPTAFSAVHIPCRSAQSLSSVFPPPAAFSAFAAVKSLFLLVCSFLYVLNALYGSGCSIFTIHYSPSRSLQSLSSLFPPPAAFSAFAAVKSLFLLVCSFLYVLIALYGSGCSLFTIHHLDPSNPCHPCSRLPLRRPRSLRFIHLLGKGSGLGICFVFLLAWFCFGPLQCCC
jgi:hypothetical protein